MEKDIAALKESILRSLTAGDTPHQKHEVSPEEFQARMEKVREKDQALAAQQARQQWETDLARMSAILPARFRLATAANVPAVAERLERLASGKGLHKTSIIFSGVVGSGKTWLAYGYVLDAIKRGILSPQNVDIMTESTLSSISRSGYSKDEKLQQLFDPRKKLYVIDDVGQAYFRDESVRNEVWFDLIDHIYRNNLTLILTTNLPTRRDNNQLQGYLGSAVYSRLMSLTGGDIITPSTMDRRPEVFTAMENGTYGPEF